MTSLSGSAAIQKQYGDASASLESAQMQIELQVGLQNAIALCSSIKSENADLKQQLSDANAFSAANLQRHSQWKDAWKIEHDSALQRERSLEREEAKWKVKLEERKKELDDLERKQNIEDGGVQLGLLKDMEVEYSSKTESLAQEASKWREQFYGSRKNYEELLAKNNGLQSRVEREKDIAESFQKENASLQSSFSEHIECEKVSLSCTSEGLIRDLKHQLEEKELLLDHLHQEVKCMRKARDDVICSNDELIASHQAEQQKNIQERAKNEANKQTLERRIQTAKKEVSQAISTKVELEDSLKCTNREIDRLRVSLAVKEDGHKLESEKFRQRLKLEGGSFKKQLAASDVMLVEQQAKIKDLERICSETREHAIQQIAHLAKDLKRDDNSGKLLLTAQDQIIKLETKCTDLQTELKQLEQCHHTEIQRLQYACESCHKDLNLVLLEKNETDRNAASERVLNLQKIKNLEGSQRSLLKAEEKCQLMVDANTKLSQKIEDLECDNSYSTSKVKSTLEELNSLKEKVLSDQKKFEKEVRRSESYKGKAIEAHKRSIKAKEVLDSLCTTK